MTKISVIVVDDEFFNRSLISMLIPQLNDNFTIIGEATNINEAYVLINEIKPEVVFLDIKMPEGSGFELFKKFNTVDFEVVFVTGFDEYALKALAYNALDYVLKPIDLDKLTQTLDLVFSRLRKDVAANLLTGVGTKKIPIHQNDNVILLALDEVMYIHAQENGTVFSKFPGTKFTSQKQLPEFEFTLTGCTAFIRINKDTYINLNFLRSYTAEPVCGVMMVDNYELTVPEEYKQQVIEVLEKVPGK